MRIMGRVIGLPLWPFDIATRLGAVILLSVYIYTYRIATIAQGRDISRSLDVAICSIHDVRNIVAMHCHV